MSVSRTLDRHDSTLMSDRWSELLCTQKCMFCPGVLRRAPWCTSVHAWHQLSPTWTAVSAQVVGLFLFKSGPDFGTRYMPRKQEAQTLNTLHMAADLETPGHT